MGSVWAKALVASTVPAATAASVLMSMVIAFSPFEQSWICRRTFKAGAQEIGLPKIVRSDGKFGRRLFSGERLWTVSKA